MRRGMTALRGRPTLFKVCLEDLGSSRRQTTFKKFLAALTKGGPGGVPRPIEVHAHDPLRYVGDMLAWLHQVRFSPPGGLGILKPKLPAAGSKRLITPQKWMHFFLKLYRGRSTHGI